MTQSLVTTQRDDDILTLTLNRPERHNALVPELLDALRAELDACTQEPPRALILAAEGRSFSSGGDVGGFYACPRPERQRYSRRIVGQLNQAILDLLRLPCPSIAAVHGMVTGGSIGLVLACDIVVVGPKASFAPWYVNVGYSPDGGWTALMPERIGRARALDVQLLNHSINADEALHWGLATRLAEDGRVRDEAHRLAHAIRGKIPGSVRRTLQLTRPDPQRVAAALDVELENFVDQIATGEADRGMAAFLGEHQGSTDRFPKE
ncbi:MAG: enoyl-CoA hydratase/isomerase family protein [Ectothiorhodospiraceae bacterium]|nr:enoyl-CoA hydratase/isomerase family protein [Ectothiorhodospiraceae bacterium]